MMRRVTAFALACMLAALGAGCSSPPSKFYTLSAIGSPPSTPLSVSVLVGPVSVPSVIDRPQIVVTTGPNQVAVDEFSRWASPVQDNLARVIADDLGTALGTSRVMLYQSPLGAEVDYRVQVEVRNFETAPGQYASLEALWSVRRLKDGKTETGHTMLREAVATEGFDALAAAHSRSVAKMSQQIADVLRALARSEQAR